MPNPKKFDAIFEGGGVKGIGFVGALAVAEEQEYRIENVAGTSAGAIVGSLAAAGYSANEMKIILNNLDYNNFKDPRFIAQIPIAGPLINLFTHKGIYQGKFFEQWLRNLLVQKNVRTFKDLIMPEYKDDPRYRYKLRVVASDFSRGKLLVLPDDIVDYGINPDDLDVAYAVRMSASIPYFFEPVILKDTQGRKCYIFDGGVLSNYPVWLFDDGTANPPWPTIGLKLIGDKEGRTHTIIGPITLFIAFFSTMMEAHDARHIKDIDFNRTVPIPTLGIRAIDFNLSSEKAENLYQSGIEAARKFFQKWDFEQYKLRCRQ